MRGCRRARRSEGGKREGPSPMSATGAGGEAAEGGGGEAAGRTGARRRPWAAEGKRGDVPAPGERREAATAAARREGEAQRGAPPREDVDGSGAGGGGDGSEAGQQQRGGAAVGPGRGARCLAPHPRRPARSGIFRRGRSGGLCGEGKRGRVLTMAAGGRQASPPQLNPPNPGLAMRVRRRRRRARRCLRL